MDSGLLASFTRLAKDQQPYPILYPATEFSICCKGMV